MSFFQAPCFARLLLLVCMLWFVLHGTSFGVDYPTGNNKNYLATIKITYIGALQLGSDPCGGLAYCEYFLLDHADIVFGNNERRRGWIRIHVEDQPSINTCALLSKPSVAFKFEVQTDRFITASQGILEHIHIRPRVTRTPWHDRLGNAQPDPWHFDWDARSKTVSVFSLWWKWIDQHNELTLDVWIDDSIIGARGRGMHLLYKFPAPLRTIYQKFQQVTPNLVPVMLIGKPPGDQSWGKLLVRQGLGAKLAIAEKDTSSHMIQESWGFGPFDKSTETIINSRENSQGSYQQWNVKQAQGLKSNNPWGPGSGDLMVTIINPTVALFEAKQDIDFRFLCAPGVPCWDIPTDCQNSVSSSNANLPPVPHVFYFPVKDLKNPPPESRLSKLSSQQLDALKKIHPLVINSRAVLEEPRYHLISIVEGSAGTFTASDERFFITGQEVEERVSSSTTHTQSSSSSYSIPISAILRPFGASIPDIEIEHAQQESNTIKLEFQNNQNLELTNGNVLEFAIGDSDPNKILNTAIYFDTLFNTFVFQDLSRPEISAEERNRLFDTRWKKLNIQPKVKGGFAVAGSLPGFSTTNRIVKLTPQDKSRPTYYVEAKANSGNLIISDMLHGEYLAVSDNENYKIKIKETGDIFFEKENELPGDNPRSQGNESCNVTVTGERSGLDGTKPILAYDSKLITGFKSSYNDWQYVQLAFDCLKEFSAIRRYMSRDGQIIRGDRGPQGEAISYSNDGNNWENLTQEMTRGWNNYINYRPHAWHTLPYGWSNWLELDRPVKARYLRIHWDGNNDVLHEIEIKE